MALLRVTPAIRTFFTSVARRTDDPRILNSDTLSGASVKADKHDKDPYTLQKETSQKHNEDGSKLTASPNDNPTYSEDAVHAEKHGKGPQELQKETAAKAQK